MTRYQVQYGETTIEYDVMYSSRKTLAIHVHPDMRVTVTAPEDADLDAIRSRVQKRANWIVRQQRDFELYLPHMTPREYVSGETHRYLGRQFRLKVIQAADREWVKLERGYLITRVTDRTDTAQIKKLVDQWYLRQARRIFRERIDLLLPRFEYLSLPEYTVQIRELQTRWGSCTESGVITLNPKLMQVAKPYIDYVIVHEMCHLIEHNHSRKFYDLLDRIMPDWRDRRHKLNAMEFV